MRHGEDGDIPGAWTGADGRSWTDHLPVIGQNEAARLARFDATQDVILAASPFTDRTRPGAPPTLAEHDALAERLAETCRRYLAAHALVKGAA